MSFSKEHRANTLSGVLFVALFALSSLYLADISWIKQTGISSLVIAIVLGIIYSNTLRHRLPREWTPGIQFSAKQLLRLAIILYGFRISFQEIASVGVHGLLLAIMVVTVVLVAGSAIGIKVFKLDKQLAILISVGTAICGAAAVLAAEDILKSEAYKTSVAIGTVVLFGTTAMFLFPFLQHLGVFGFNEAQYGLYAGASIHEVAQVVVAGNNVGKEAAAIAVIIKMTRVLLLVPALIGLSIYVNRNTEKTHTQLTNYIPWFAVGFVVMIGVNSLHVLPDYVVNFINEWDIFLLTMAMGAIGIETNLAKIKNVGLKPLYLAITLFLWLMVSNYLLIKHL